MNKTFICTENALIPFDKINAILYNERIIVQNLFDKNEHQQKAHLKLCIQPNEYYIYANSYDDESNIKEIYNNYKEYLLNKEGIKI